MRARGLGDGITIRRSDERPRTTSDGLDSRHTFAFGTYERVWNGIGALKVLNEDVIAPGRGFSPHPHWDMEILTFVLDGAVEHADSTGARAVVHAGEAQLMSAGTGVEHSERNASPTAPLRLLQAWILPDTKGLPVRHQQLPARPGAWRCLAAPDGRDGALVLRQDAAIWAGHLARHETVTHAPAAGRRTWIQVADGSLAVATPVTAPSMTTLAAGDGSAWIGPAAHGPLALRAGDDGARFLLFDLA